MEDYLRFAYHRRISLDDALNFGYNEFLEFKLADKIEWTRRSKQDYYLAQIAFVLACVNAGKNTKLKFDDFMFNFKDQKPMTPEEQMIASMNAWEMATGKKAL